MSIEIYKLTPELADEYFDFFNQRAFSDREGAFCYCTWFHFNCTIEEHYKYGKSVMQSQADMYIKSGKLNGYLAFINGVSIGWCNVDNKENYERINNPAASSGICCFGKEFDSVFNAFLNAPRGGVLNPSHTIKSDPFLGRNSAHKIKAIVCFAISPDFRKKGVATALLHKAVEDAKTEGYFAIESYPRLHKKIETYDYTGPIRLYEKEGFVKMAEQESTLIMRKEL